MDPLNAFKNEVFRPIASLVLPGMLAIGPFAIVLGNSVPEVADLYQKQSVIFFLLMVSAGTIAGMLLENIGSSIERGIDQCMEVEYLRGADAVWAVYLKTPCSDVYARKYLGTLVTRIKFINSMIPATFFFTCGLLALKFQIGRWDGIYFGICIALLFLLMTWLFKSSTELSEAALFSRFQMLPDGHGIELDTSKDTVSRFRHAAYVVVELATSRVTEFDFHDLSWGKVLLIIGGLIVRRPVTSGRVSADGKRRALGDPVENLEV